MLTYLATATDGPILTEFQRDVRLSVCIKPAEHSWMAQCISSYQISSFEDDYIRGLLFTIGFKRNDAWFSTTVVHIIRRLHVKRTNVRMGHFREKFVRLFRRLGKLERFKAEHRGCHANRAVSVEELSKSLRSAYESSQHRLLIRETPRIGRQKPGKAKFYSRFSFFKEKKIITRVSIFLVLGTTTESRACHKRTFEEASVLLG